MPNKLGVNEIKYLAFEGGGGKGNAYLGAIQALETEGVLQYSGFRPASNRLLGFSGTSAGAITATLISFGFKSEEIKFIMRNQNFLDFFDNPEVGKVPLLSRDCDTGTPIQMGSTPAWVAILDTLMERNTANPFDAFATAANLAQRLAANFTGGQNLSTPVAYILMGILQIFVGKLPLEVRQKITRNKIVVARSLASDRGIFPGCPVRDFLKKWITIARYRITHEVSCERRRQSNGPERALQALVNLYLNWPSPMEGIEVIRDDPADQNRMERLALDEYSFENHQRDFGVKLAVMGTNLETMKSHVFSSFTTPGISIAGAVRISMSLPLILKPVVIRPVYNLPNYLWGTWVDGGLFNNIPLHVFDNITQDRNAEKTLGIRLDIEHRERIDSLLKFIQQWPLSYALGGAGESNVSETLGDQYQTISLDPTPLDLLDFNPSDAIVDQVTARSRTKTFDYFKS